LIKIWVNHKYFIIDPISGIRCFDPEHRVIYEFDGEAWDTIYANQTCMRFTKVVTLETGEIDVI